MKINKSPACRQEGESKQDCVSRKIPEILAENPDMDNDQAVAIAHSVCDEPCEAKENRMKQNKVQYLSKKFGVELLKDATKTEDGYLLKKGYFTSDSVDEVGDIITRGATERAIPKYRQWGNIRYMHQPRPVALVERIGTENGLEWNEVEIKVIDPQAIFEVETGLLKALSVGIMIKDFDDVTFTDDGGLVINDYSLAEISLVDHPANYDAVLKSGEASVPWKSAVIKDHAASLSKALGLQEEEMDVTETVLEVAAPEGEISTDDTAAEELPVEEIATENASTEEIRDEITEAPIEEVERVIETEETTPVEPAVLPVTLSETDIDLLAEKVTARVLDALKSLVLTPSEVQVAPAQVEETLEETEAEETEVVEDGDEKRMKALEEQVSELLKTAPRKPTIEQPLPASGVEERAEVRPVDLVERAKVKVGSTTTRIVPRT